MRVSKNFNLKSLEDEYMQPDVMGAATPPPPPLFGPVSISCSLVALVSLLFCQPLIHFDAALQTLLEQNVEAERNLENAVDIWAKKMPFSCRIFTPILKLFYDILGGESIDRRKTAKDEATNDGAVKNETYWLFGPHQPIRSLSNSCTVGLREKITAI